MFYQTSLSPQMKQCAIITDKHGINELPQGFLNDVRLRNVGNIGNISLNSRMLA